MIIMKSRQYNFGNNSINEKIPVMKINRLDEANRLFLGGFR